MSLRYVQSVWSIGPTTMMNRNGFNASCITATVYIRYQNKKLNSLDTLHRAPFYIRPIYQVSTDLAVSTVKFWHWSTYIFLGLTTYYYLWMIGWILHIVIGLNLSSILIPYWIHTFKFEPIFHNRFRIKLIDRPTSIHFYSAEFNG